MKEAPLSAFSRLGVSGSILRGMVSGDEVRDWSHAPAAAALFPYGDEFEPIDLASSHGAYRFMWPYRTDLSNNKMFGKQTKVESGLKWWEYGRLTTKKLRVPFSITFVEVATHNHFVLDRGGKVFKQTAPVIKLPAKASEDEHLGLLGLLNSSVACFWLKQVCHNKGGGGINEGHRGDKWEFFYAFNSTKIAEFPLIEARPLDLAKSLDALVQQRSRRLPAALLADAQPLPSRAKLDAARAESESQLRRMIALQEELDWRCYRLYGLLPEGAGELEHANPPEVRLGERAFEIVLARRMAAGKESTTWFERHGSTPITEVPAHWPEDYRALVERRIALIESERNIGLIERPEYKRRWNTPAWEELEQAALRDWLLARLESPRYWPRGEPAQLSSINRLADAARLDADFMQIAELYAGRADFDVTRLVEALVVAESVPFLPVLRYTDSGLRKRAQWEDCWDLQRREDAGDASATPLGRIPVPPKYQSKDFQKADCWRLRGSLDVPKERWVSYPGCERGADGSLPIAWAGWDHLQQATALAAYYLDMKDSEGWPSERLLPLLAGLLELLPWLKQWHNQLDPNFGERMGDYYDGFVRDEAKALGVTLEALRAWKPAVTAARRGRRRSVA
ncbi:BREX-2 system adenine-specific DNA-methyltransferase PglX [Rhodocyclus purpureus]|uniref:BREX-2 system adenine-specific DNA-methyltransferase PglX n=1 Tax=Rhodocyclus purpureus TaxID=1067 RepID=UPI00237B9086|nr:BREX-2 system adenine-specific DNA-methyltransferase PglX [Rhodocyclus purpureus]